MPRPAFSGSLLALAVAACSSVPPAAKAPPGFHFNYASDGRERTSLVQAFDDGHRTYLQFRDPDTMGASLTLRADGDEVKWQKQDRYAVADGIYATLTVSAGHGETVVSNRDLIKHATGASGAPETQPK